MAGVEAERPGIAAAPTRAGLPRDPVWAELRQRAGEHIGHRVRGTGREEIGARRRLAGEQAQRAAGAVGGERGIERGRVTQRDAVAAECERQRRIGAMGQPERRAGEAERGGEAQRADAVEQRHRRQVQRAAQRLGRGDAAGETAIEILRRVAAEAARQVGHHRVRRGDAVGEGHRIDERLQRRTGGAHRERQVDGAGAGLIAPGAGIQRADLARGGIGHQHGERGTLRQGFQSLLPEPLQRRLQRQVQRGSDQRRSRQRCRELGRVARQRRRGRSVRAWRRHRTGRRGRRPPALDPARRLPRRRDGPGAGVPAGAGWRPTGRPAPVPTPPAARRTRRASQPALLPGCRRTARG